MNSVSSPPDHRRAVAACGYDMFVRLYLAAGLACLAVFFGPARVCAAPAVPLGILAPDSDQRLRMPLPDLHMDLRGEWAFALDPNGVGEAERWFAGAGTPAWDTIVVPGSWQAQGWGIDSHGTGWYRRTVPLPPAWGAKRVWIRFGAAATHATLWVNGQPCGEHTGDWTPFEFDISGAVKCGEPNTFTIRCEELPEHFGAGFPRTLGEGTGHDLHFGGIWQEVSLFACGERHVADLAAFPNLADGQVRLTAAFTHQGEKAGRVIFTVGDAQGNPVAETPVPLAADGSAAEAVLSIPNVQAWSPEAPVLYWARAVVWCENELSDSRTIRFGMRDVRRDGTRLLLNGQPLMIRGVLHSGYYPDLFTMDPSDTRIRQEFKELRAAGFNLVAVHMFFFPARFYEIADEMGMLIWQEYPVWRTFPKAGAPGPFDACVQAYDEWFHFDRSHPSVILRGLTGEAAEPDTALLKQVYDLAKERTGGALVEDCRGSAHPVASDWCDERIRCDLDDCLHRVEELAGRLRQAPEPQPFIAGEAFENDMYRDLAPLRRRYAVENKMPWWLDGPGMQQQEAFERGLGAAQPAEFARRQRRHLFATWKTSIEAFRKRPELNGYVLAGIRDNPVTRSGFYDDCMRMKWHAEEWRAFNADRVLLLQSPRDSMCFRDDETPNFEIRLSNMGMGFNHALLRWTLTDGHSIVARGETPVSADTGQCVAAATCNAVFGRIKAPVLFHLSAELRVTQEPVRNEWSVWVFPSRPRLVPNATLYVRDDEQRDMIQPAFDGMRVRGLTWAAGAHEWRETANGTPVDWSAGGTTLLSSRLDAPVRVALEHGAHVVYVAAEDDTSVPRRETPFWRETAIWLPSAHPALGDFPQEGYIDGPFLEMTQRRPFDLGAMREAVTPVIWGVNTRFEDTGFSDYLFEARLGAGRVLGCCLRLGGAGNVAGQYLLRGFIQYGTSPLFDAAPVPEVGLASHFTAQ